MKKAYARIGLFAGVSVVALGLAAPALAAPTHHASIADDLLTVGNIGDTAVHDGGSDRTGSRSISPGALTPNTSEQISVGTGEVLGSPISVTDVEIGLPASAVAQASCSISGQCSNSAAMVQRATDPGSAASNKLGVAGRIDIGAIARATGSSALAGAFVQTGIWQHASGSTASNMVANSGSIGVSARAAAVAASGDAGALVSLAFGGVAQTAIASAPSGLGHNEFANSGSMSIDALAAASAAHSATASGYFQGGIIQQADGIASAHASNEIDNDGTITVDLSASATGGTGALAFAEGSNAIMQLASARNAKDLIGNSGAIAVSVGAAAHGGSAAGAVAVLETGIFQLAGSVGPDAAASINLENSGDISLAAAAEASAHGPAFAEAVLVGGITQNADAHGSGGKASAAISNSGSIAALGSAHATGVGSAQAYAIVSDAVVQNVLARSASASFDNSGSLAIGEVAHGSGGAAFAGAHMSSAVHQVARGSAASVSVDNQGTIAVTANAAALGSTIAFASASVASVIRQDAEAKAGGAAATLGNSGTITLGGSVDAAATGIATALVNVHGVLQTAAAQTISRTTGSSGNHMHYSRLPEGPASVSLENTGTLSFGIKAHASAGDRASALGSTWGVFQQVQGAKAEASFDNKDKVAGLASAEATGGQAAYALASVIGVIQSAHATGTRSSLSATTSGSGHFERFRGGFGPAHASLSNSGDISIVAHAHAILTDTKIAASRSAAPVGAEAEVSAILQNAMGSEATASLSNSGSIHLGASASASGFDYGLAHIFGHGFIQEALALASISSVNWTPSGVSHTGGLAFTGNAVVDFTNSGVFDLKGAASVRAGASALLGMYETGGQQIARGNTAEVSLKNSGTFNVAADGKVIGAKEDGFVLAVGAVQSAVGIGSARVRMDNSGTIAVDGKVQGTALDGGATDQVIAVGLRQQPNSPGIGSATLVNSGMISVAADAKAKASSGIPLAIAAANDVVQNPRFSSVIAALDNSGKIVAHADASAVGDGAAYASAAARGYSVDAANITADVVNSGSIAVAATAHALGTGGSAAAGAVGMTLIAANHGSSGDAGAFAGTILNKGQIHASARVDSANGGTVAASASGISISATRNNATLVNSGLIDVQAVTTNGGPADAWGVHALTGSSGDPTQNGDLFTFTNDGGTIIVRKSVNGGGSWQRGMAIDVSAAPNRSVVNLIGNGTIYGDIAVQSADRINVRQATTYFDGIINPSFLPTVGITGAALDSGLAGVGTLTIADGGNLVLADPRMTGPANMYAGPSYLFLDTLNVASDGALTFELQPISGGIQAAGTYSQVFAGTANISGGMLEARVATVNGLFADRYVWNNLIDANNLVGKFDACTLGGGYAGSVLLSVNCSRDSGNNIDLTVARTAFDAVSGLSGNARAVGGGLERIYNPGLTGGVAKMFGDLFLITDPARYRTALNELSGSVYANYLGSFASLGTHYNDLLDRAINCEDAEPGGSILECRSTSPFRLWGQIDYQNRSADGDDGAGRSVAKRFTEMLGVDARVGESALVGVEVGPSSNQLDDRGFGDSVKGKGVEAGLYAVYDPGRFYLKGLTTYSWFNGDATRHVDFTQLAAGGSFRGTPTGHPDTRMWTVGVHGGARLPLGADSDLIPYVDLDYVNARLDGFAETGLDGANLTVAGSKTNHAFVTGGVKWATHLGGVIPEVSLGYRYRGGDQRSHFNAFLGSDQDSGFTIESAAQKRGTFLAGLSVGGKLGRVDVQIGYEGEFDGRVTSHSGNFKLVLPLGGHAH